ncbi:hypothetical protein ACW4T5_003436, partial [Vibrio cholerae]
LIERQILITAYRLSQYSSSTMFNHPKLSKSSYCSLFVFASFCVYPMSALYPLYRARLAIKPQSAHSRFGWLYRAIKKPMRMHRLVV